MKKVIALAALLGMASLSFGQGTVNFNNTTKSLVRTNSLVGGATTGAMTTTANSYYFALFVAAPTVTTETGLSDPNWTFTGLYATNSTGTAGQFSGTPGSSINGFAGGSTVSLFAVGWSANIGSDLASAIAWYNNGNVATTGWWGVSLVATSQVLGGGAQGLPAANPFGTTSTQAPAFNLTRIDPVPEPTTLALAGLGAAALMIFRRRK